jgi:hypothetical protein
MLQKKEYQVQWSDSVVVGTDTTWEILSKWLQILNLLISKNCMLTY